MADDPERAMVVKLFEEALRFRPAALRIAENADPMAEFCLPLHQILNAPKQAASGSAKAMEDAKRGTHVAGFAEPEGLSRL
jgi:hypothetical protein